MKNAFDKARVSARNKKRKDHKPIQEEQVEEVKKKRKKRPKKAKNKIDHIRPRILNDDELKTARQKILEQFNKGRNNDKSTNQPGNDEPIVSTTKE